MICRAWRKCRVNNFLWEYYFEQHLLCSHFILFSRKIQTTKAVIYLLNSAGIRKKAEWKCVGTRSVCTDLEFLLHMISMSILFTCQPNVKQATCRSPCWVLSHFCPKQISWLGLVPDWMASVFVLHTIPWFYSGFQFPSHLDTEKLLCATWEQWSERIR